MSVATLLNPGNWIKTASLFSKKYICIYLVVCAGGLRVRELVIIWMVFTVIFEAGHPILLTPSTSYLKPHSTKISSIKHHFHDSPGSNDLITGCRVFLKCFVLCWFLEASQHPTWPHAKQSQMYPFGTSFFTFFATLRISWLFQIGLNDMLTLAWLILFRHIL